jgi:hypothetical protein
VLASPFPERGDGLLGEGELSSEGASEQERSGAGEFAFDEGVQVVVAVPQFGSRMNSPA